MRGRSILDDVTIDELLQMREQGMTNAEIADALDVGVNTVVRYIGKQPKGLRKPYERKEPRPVEPKHEETAPTACLVVQNREIELHGLHGKYTVSCKEREVLASVNIFEDMDVVISLDDIENIVKKLGEISAELQAIARKVNELNVSNEMW